MAESKSPQTEADTVVVRTPVVACEGGNRLALGHPLVFLTFGAERKIVCPYCSRTFVLADDAAPGQEH